MVTIHIALHKNNYTSERKVYFELKKKCIDFPIFFCQNIS